ncbi:putative quinol monooxygenase [Daejeonella oryzae]|uniref:putative quinol monooxygenase n=1 Tax=Daejeonella oryzae TaxID=1122943 RepID=UPI00041BAD8D|nr:antibiotic biosynthesis monooxygenase [Daejeonella oryzae]
MIKFGLLATLEAKPGKETELHDFLISALPLAQDEPGTKTWYAFRINSGTYGIFDSFETEEAREAHLSGPIARALMEKAAELLAKDPVIEKTDILAAK